VSTIPFAPSIAILSLVQASLLALPASRALPPALRLTSRWWALALPGSVVAVIVGISLLPGLADGLTYLALAAVPPLAALALGWAMHGARPALALLPIPLFALAWAIPQTLAGEAAAVLLSALGCVTLGVLVAAIVPARWLRLGIYAMAAIDAYLVGADLLQSPNDVLIAAAPAAGLPQLQFAHFGSAVLGFGDLFIAAVLGALLAGDRALQLRGTAIAASVLLAFDLLFFLVSLLPATVPIALTLAILRLTERRRAFSGSADRRAARHDPRGAAA
jgi:hypothetical protein